MKLTLSKRVISGSLALLMCAGVFSEAISPVFATSSLETEVVLTTFAVFVVCFFCVHRLPRKIVVHDFRGNP